MTHPVSPMLRLFRDGAPSYQPSIAGLDEETGNPQVSLDNIQRLLETGLGIMDFLVRPNGILVLFLSGEHYYAPGLRVGTSGSATTALAHLAAKAGFGPEAQLRQTYKDLPEDYEGQLVNLNIAMLGHPMP